MANYTINQTGANISQAIVNALALASAVSTVSVTIDETSVSLNVLWEVAPTSSNTVYGLAVHPTNGKLYRIKSANNTVTAKLYSPEGTKPQVDGTTLSFVDGE